MSPDYYAECTCDTLTEPGFPHRPWCATEHQCPGPDCPGLCESAAEQNAAEVTR